MMRLVAPLLKGTGAGLALLLALALGHAHAAPLTPSQLPAQSSAADGDLLVVWPIATDGPLHSMPFASMVADVQARLNTVYTRPAGTITTGDCVQWAGSFQIQDAGIGCGTSAAITRAQIPTQNVGANKALVLSGYATNGDAGAGCIYTSQGATSTGPGAIQDAGGNWFNYAVSGQAAVGCLGAFGDYKYAQFEGVISGTSLTALNIKGPNTPAIGMNVAGASAGTVITGGSAPNFTINNSQTVAGASCSSVAIVGTALAAAGCTGQIAIGQLIATGAGVTSGTVVVSGSGSSWVVSPSQTVGAEPMTFTAFMGAWSGHDDAAAFQAAAATGQNIVANGPAPSSINAFLPTAAFAIGSTIAMSADGQQVTGSNVSIDALPGSHEADFTGSIACVTGPVVCTLTTPSNSGVAVGDVLSSTHTPYGTVVQSGSGTTWIVNSSVAVGSEAMVSTHPLLYLHGAREGLAGVAMDGQQQIGVSAVGVSSDGSSDFVDAPQIFHFAVAGVALVKNGSQSARIADGQIGEWTNGDSQFADSNKNWTATNLIIASGDNKVEHMVLSWSGMNALYSGGGVLSWLDNHPFNGCSGCATPHSSAINLEQTADSTGTLLSIGNYTDDGSYELYSNKAILRGTFVGSSHGFSLTPNLSFINIYPDGTLAPFSNDIDISGPGSFLTTGDTLFALPDNPNLLTITGASGDGTHETFTIGGGFLQNAPLPAVNSAVTVSGASPSGWNCTRCPVTASTAVPPTFTVAGTQTGAFSSGQAQLAWSLDYSGVAPLNTAVANAVPVSVWSGPKALIMTGNDAANNRRILQFNQANGACVDLGFGVGGQTPAHSCWLGGATGGITEGAGTSGITTWTHQFGDETNAGFLQDDGIGNFYLGNDAATRWQIVHGTGALVPVTNKAMNIGTTGRLVNSTNVFQYNVNTTLAISGTAPTISSGFGTSPSISSNNGTAAFRINVGSGNAATSGVIGMPTAANGWNCTFKFLDPASHLAVGQSTEETASTASSVSISNYNAAGAGALIAWPANATLNAQCMAF